MRGIAILVVACAGCYTGAPATRDVNASWRGHTSGEIRGRWGAPRATTALQGATVQVWAHDNLHVTLPSASGALSIGPNHFDLDAQATRGEIWKTTTEAAAFVLPTGIIEHVEGASLRWGPPNDENLHWGAIFGAHVGMGRLDATSTPLPSGGAYMGGMLARQLGLVGTFSLAAGSDDAGSALGFAWGVAVQYWPVTRLWVRAGPAAILAFAPGFKDPGFSIGGTAGASYAIVKVGTFAVDLRFDIAASADVTLGTAGVGVSVN